jgi:hypothetical protein
VAATSGGWAIGAALVERLLQVQPCVFTGVVKVVAHVERPIDAKKFTARSVKRLGAGLAVVPRVCFTFEHLLWLNPRPMCWPQIVQV